MMRINQFGFKAWASASVALAVLLAPVPSVFSADPPLELSCEFTLSGNSTFFKLMSARGGIKPALDRDYTRPFTIVDAETFREKASNFDHIERLEGKIEGGAAGLDRLVEAIAGQEVTVDQLYGIIYNKMKELRLFRISDARQRSRLAGALAPIVGLASGKGVLVRLDDENYVYNFGYAVGSGGKDLEADKINRRTGRSYGASIERNSYDPTDVDYLKALGAYVGQSNERELRKFYTTLFEMLLKSDSSGLQRLAPAGQTVMADFMAIYMAELDRHLMTGLRRYEWENALTEITMLAAYSASDHGITFSIDEVDNAAGRTNTESRNLRPNQRMVGFFGVGTDGSGLDGANKRRRHKLTRQVGNQVRALNEGVVTRIENLIRVPAGSDIYDEVLEYINNYRTQTRLAENADELIELLVEFVLTSRNQAQAITPAIR